jgi:hypothetical protein
MSIIGLFGCNFGVVGHRLHIFTLEGYSKHSLDSTHIKPKIVSLISIIKERDQSMQETREVISRIVEYFELPVSETLIQSAEGARLPSL